MDNQNPIQDLENLPATPTLEPDTSDIKDLILPSQIPTADLYKDYSAKLEKALENNNNWKEQIYLCLDGVNKLVNAFITFREVQDSSLKELPRIQAQTEYIKDQVKRIEEISQTYNAYFDQFNAIMGKNNSLINQNFLYVQNEISLANSVLTQTTNNIHDILKYKADVESTLTKLNALPESQKRLNALFTQAETYLSDLNKARIEAQTSIVEHSTEAQNALQSLRGQLDTNLSQRALELQNNLKSLESSLAQSVKQKLEQTNNQIEQHKKLAQEKLQEMQRYLSVAVKLRDYALGTQKALDNILKSALEQINATTANQKSALETHTESLKNQTQENLKNYKLALLSEFNKDSTSIATQIATLKTLLEKLQARSTKLGLDFTTTTYTENATFSVPKTGIYYYVFLQSGSGSSDNTNNQNVTSFGDKLSISTPNNATTGAIKSAWIKLETQEDISISVGSGGLCVVSYATRLKIEDVAKDSIADTTTEGANNQTETTTEGASATETTAQSTESQTGKN
ncbi:hypothetical protein [Helicobacter suis]|uniref:hypothetical protein n=1 Tax=Helicobacter suis TaxID=104628 RepID=UPI0013D25DF5|nr:hypothetical protein [Helicobacter suis]